MDEKFWRKQANYATLFSDVLCQLMQSELPSG